MKRTIVISGIVAFLVFGCKKESTIDNGGQNSLTEFFASLPNGDSNLINILPIIDNSGFKVGASKQNHKSLASINRGNSIASVDEEFEDIDSETGIKIKLKWPGLDRYGNPCNAAIGICVTIPLNQITSDVTVIGEDDLGPNSVIRIIDDKLIIEPITNQTGLTSDGYLPVADYMPISENLLIKPGIYRGSPEKIILDLVKVD